MLHADPGIEQSQTIQDWQLEGTTDAAFGRNPAHTDNAAYLNGWIQEVARRLKMGERLEIRWLSYAYVTGGYDAPDYEDMPY